MGYALFLLLVVTHGLVWVYPSSIPQNKHIYDSIKNEERNPPILTWTVINRKLITDIQDSGN